jgi:hypothetical protein
MAEDFRRYRDAWAQPGALTAMLNWYRALRLPAASPAAARVRVPVRLIWGDPRRLSRPRPRPRRHRAM